MKKFTVLVFCATMFLLSQFSLFANEKANLFIDISGSMHSTLPEIQAYITGEYFTQVSPQTELRIYKFYGKLRHTPIFAGTLKDDATLKFATSQVNALAANGPWTNLTTVLNFIKESPKEYGDAFIIFTDGIQETEDGLNDYVLTQEMLSDVLGNNIKLIDKGSWKHITYTHQKDYPIPQQAQERIPEKHIIKNEPTMIMQAETDGRKTIAFNWKILIPILIILALIALIFLFIKASGGRATTFAEIKSKPLTKYKPNVAIDNAIASENILPQNTKKVSENESLADKIAHTPIKYGIWTGERGNSKYKPTDIEGYVQNGQYKDKEADIQLIFQLHKKYKIDGINYKNGEPDFTPVAEFVAPINCKLTGNYNANVPILHKILAEEMNQKNFLNKNDWKPQDVKAYCEKNWLALHESSDGKVQLVHTYLHDFYKHSGLRADIRNNK